MLQVFRLDLRRELGFFPKDWVPRWVEFRVNMEAPPATRVVILSPPHQGVSDRSVAQEACGFS